MVGLEHNYYEDKYIHSCFQDFVTYCIAEYYRVLQSVRGCYKVLQSVTEC